MVRTHPFKTPMFITHTHTERERERERGVDAHTHTPRERGGGGDEHTHIHRERERDIEIQNTRPYKLYIQKESDIHDMILVTLWLVSCWNTLLDK